MEITSDISKTKKRKAELLNLYQKWYENDTCKYFEECCQGRVPQEFWTCFDYSARIGDNYYLFFDGMPVRILVIGKEPKAQKPLRFTNRPERWWPDINRHYLVTFNMLKNMLSYYPTKNAVVTDAVLTMFTLSNLYSCSFRKYDGQFNGIPNTTQQMSNCLLLRKKELKILEPTIVIIQNDNIKASWLFDDAVLKFMRLHGNVYYSEKDFPCYIVETSHPCCRSHPWKSDLNDCIDYLKEISALPQIDYREATSKLNALIK